MPTVLLVEDDENLRLLLTQRLKRYYTVLSAGDGSEALRLLNDGKADLLITDIAMPKMDGFDLARSVRESGSLIPILIITANQSLSAKRTGFSLGTDDYLTKPFDTEELLWRIKALLRRVKIESDRKIEAGDIIADKDSYSVIRGEVSYSLPKKEFELLYKLLSRPGRIYTRNQLFEDIWGNESESGEDTVKTHISRLRNKLKEIDTLSIVAVKGIGYKAEVEEK